ncbi:prolyl oligopeptidase family serine peptidase [Streptomyces sp. NBC_00237]|uniref:S9 family peptidase n=1 Tax=Streptomyces sp. NBC_00237 TaxID=2975687 RepID=UPI0022532699|nr:prolyl oligopeptidase family serine peptidase [Streptomyces sp. NBC_00237]MCX5205477.1 prolyl oligopeptidase family serine peptidase [Streptomyces sp. NBC_00237]
MTAPAPRYRVFRAALPEVCSLDPTRMAFTADADGRCEVFTWDTVTATARQVTDRPGGTFHCSVDADAHVWWFEEDTHGFGRWRFQPFEGGPTHDGLRGVPVGQARGLAVSAGGAVALALGDGEGTTVYGGRRGGPARRVTRLPYHASLTGISTEGDLLAVGGQARSPYAVTVFRTSDGARVAQLGEERAALWSLGFTSAAGRRDLLLVREHAGRYLLATWRPGEPVRTHAWAGFDTEITARWRPDGRSVLIRQDRHGRSILHRADLDTRTLTVLPTAPGTLLDAVEHAGGDLHTLWTSTAEPPRATSSAGTPLPTLPRLPDPVPGVSYDVWTPGADGDLHTLVTLPEGARGPVPTVFLVHGGPADHDRDAYDGTVHSLVASGFGVARVNYRGSTGYGPAWRAAMTEGVGLTQVADLAAARADLVERGWADPDSLALWGTSWGGYLTLLALGVRPGLWQAGVAVKPVAHLARAHATTTPALRALDERLFGGTPDELPEAYARSSPHTWLPDLRAPLLIVAARHDAKCPPGQIDDYAAELTKRQKEHDLLWLDTGHDGYDGADHVLALRTAVLFLDRTLRGSRTPRGDGASRGRPRTTPTASPAARRGESGPTERKPVPAGDSTSHHSTERTTHHAEGHHQQRPARG